MNEEQKSWYTIYPAYLNANRTHGEGRRISKAKCVADPRWQEIKDVLEANKEFTVTVDANKVYPRELDKELPACRGRIKYQTTNPKYKSKREVLLYLGETIPKLKTRAKGSGQAAVVQEQPSQQAKGKKGKGRKN